MDGISFVIATKGRDSLVSTIASIELEDIDEVIVIGAVEEKTAGNIRCVPCPSGGDWGATERNVATGLAQGRYLAFIDDDDVYVAGHRALMQDALTRTPGRPVLFRMRYPGGRELWEQPVLRSGNVGTPMILIPNDPDRLGRWTEGRYENDFGFLDSMKWSVDEIAWRPEVIAQIGPHL